MSNIKVITDSTCDLSDELLYQYDISMIPLCILLGEKSYKDRLEISPDQIFKWSDKEKETPKTAAPELGTVIDILYPFVKEGREIIFIGISAQMSVTCNTVRLAAKELEYEKIAVIDSKNLSTGIGLQALRAAKLIKEGFSFEQIQKELESSTSLVRSSFVVDTLTYLHRGGRCSSVTALLANTLKLKPEIIVENGKMGVGKKYRGNHKSALRKYSRDLKSALLKADPECVFITHSGCEPAILDDIHDYLKTLNYFNKILITRAGGVISSHCGPNTLGILFYCK